MSRALAAALFVLSAFAATPSAAADSCGFFAIAGAFPSFPGADRRSDEIGGSAWGLDSSDSPNAGRGLWVVAEGPGSRAQAEGWARDYRAKGVGDAYVTRRCFFGE
ncbi:hypothetical protein U0C82_02975 [Fulvimarina sp. 2208YS6-2-32]|uniref:Uncharacterized protein n=1 Tax=Fulvimarina uroteuthidis TaxID=3098149 RepID=A0ABU5HYE4_9HYPH|nr:hypothetical protein [Fulvimarina sp. 2208YS6-2-32]MDY8108112.1 hypothetical protein [Fulvimarina sp. 2208YS6-2-32]